MKNPRVSVLTPIYNTNPIHLREMIESILNQTFKDFEFLILNDSPDNKEIEKIVLEYAKHDKRIKYSKNKKNMGITPSRNKLIKMARGEYLAVFDHDDISVPERLEKEVKYLDENPYVGVVSGWIKYFDKTDFLQKYPEKDIDIKIYMSENSFIAHPAAMIRKSVLIDNNIEYEEYYSPAEDYRLWARLMDITHFYNIPEVLLKYRFHGNNTSQKQADKMFHAWRTIKLETQDKHPVLSAECEKILNKDWRLRLFGKIPFLKRKNNWILLFDFIPLLKVRGL